MTNNLTGIYPVVLTPFHPDDRIDWEGYGRLLDWYLTQGVDGLFAVCQSSEMQHLTLAERRDLARFTVDHVRGRVPVVASGHISDRTEDQIAELRAMAETGVDAVVLVTNRLAAAGEAPGTLIARTTALLAALPGEVTFGLYECPAPFRRLLTDDELRHLADSGRFAFLKDVACDLDVVKRRLALTRGTPLAINNANAAIAWPVMQAGGQRFAGVMNNFHPDLYARLYRHGAAHPEAAARLEPLPRPGRALRSLRLSAACQAVPPPARHLCQRTFARGALRPARAALGDRRDPRPPDRGRAPTAAEPARLTASGALCRCLRRSLVPAIRGPALAGSAKFRE